MLDSGIRLGIIAACVALAGAACSSGGEEQHTSREREAASVPSFSEQRDDPAAALFDQNDVHTFDLVVSAADLAVLDADPAAEEYVDGFLDFGGQRFGPIGVRYKGSFGAFVGCVEDLDAPDRPRGAKTCTKLSLKLKFDGSYDVDFFGVDKVQLHSQNLDPTMMHERLGYAMFRRFGVPAPRSTHARVTMNGELLGLFALTEQIDEQFLETVFDDSSGNLYKDAWPVTDDQQSRSDRYFAARLETNSADPLPFDVVRELGDALVDPSGNGGLAAIEPLVDTDVWFRYLVVDRAIGHDDGPLRFDCPDDVCGNKNYYLYDDPSIGEVSIIAWDLDSAFSTLTRDRTRSDQLVLEIADEWHTPSNGCEPFAHGPAGLIQRSPACDPLIAAFADDVDRYHQLRDEFLDGPYSAVAVDDLIDTWADQIEPFVIEADSAHVDAISVEEWRSALEALRADVAAERNR